MLSKLDPDKSILEYNISPLYLAAGILFLVILFILGSRALSLTGLIEIDSGTPWLVACSFTLFYALFSSVFSLSAEDQNKYWLHALIGYLIITVGGGLIAFLFSGITMSEAGGYKVIYVVFTMGYILLLGIMRSMRKIVKIAQKQDKRLRGEE